MLRLEASILSLVGRLILKKNQNISKIKNEARLILECWRRMKADSMKAGWRNKGWRIKAEIKIWRLDLDLENSRMIQKKSVQFTGCIKENRHLFSFISPSVLMLQLFAVYGQWEEVLPFGLHIEIYLSDERFLSYKQNGLGYQIILSTINLSYTLNFLILFIVWVLWIHKISIILSDKSINICRAF